MDGADKENVLLDLYFKKKMRGISAVLIASYVAVIANLGLLIVGVTIPSEVLIWIFVFLAVFVKMAVVATYNVINESKDITIEDLPPVENFEGVSLLGLTDTEIEHEINQIDQTTFESQIKRLGVAIVLNIITLIAVNFMVSQPYKVIFILSIVLSSFLDIVSIFIIGRYKVRITGEVYRKWRTNFLTTWGITEEIWEENRDEFLRYHTLSLQEVKILNRYSSIMVKQGRKPPKRFAQIRTLVKGFPSLEDMQKALDLGYLSYDEYMEGEAMGCPNYEAYARSKKGGFESYHEYQYSIKKGFSDRETLIEAIKRGCENIEQLNELRAAGFTEQSYSEYQAIKTLGFDNYVAYMDAMKGGFPNANTWRLSKIHNIPDYKTMQDMIEFGMILDEDLASAGKVPYEEYKVAKKNGFPNYRTFILAGASGFTTFKQMKDAEERGFSTYEEMLKAEVSGFQTREEQQRISALGFKTKDEYEKALMKGCQNQDQYATINREGYETWDDFVHAMEKGFENATEFYAARRLGAFDKSTYKQVLEGGFDNAEEMREAFKKGFLTKEEFEEAKLRGIPDALMLDELDGKNFHSYEEYKRAKEKGFEDGEEYKLARKWGAPDYDTYLDMKTKGFTNFAEYRDAMKLGYNNIDVYHRARKIGALNYKEYLVLSTAGTTRKDYVVQMRKFLTRCSDNLSTLQEVRQSSKNNTLQKPYDFFALRKEIEILLGLMKTADILLSQLMDYEDVFEDIHEERNSIVTRLQKFRDEVDEELTPKLEVLKPLEGFFSEIKQFSVPSTLPLSQFIPTIDKCNITPRDFKDIVEKYFREEVKIDLGNQTVTYKKWIASPQEKRYVKQELVNIISTLERGTSIGLSRIKARLEFPGTDQQFEEMLEEIFESGNQLGELRLDLGLILIPEVDYYAEKYDEETLKREIRALIDKNVLSSKIAVNIMAISANISNHPPTPMFRKVIKEVLEEYPTLDFDEEGGMIRPPIGEAGRDCPMCLLQLAEGERVGMCPNCNSQTHYNELLGWVLDAKSCPECGSPLNMEEVIEVIV